MPKIIFTAAGCLFVFFITWVICCCWRLNEEETLGERIIKITKQFGKMRWFMIYTILIFTLWGGVMTKVLTFKFNKKECPPCPKITCPTCPDDTELRNKVDNFCKEHKRAGICKELKK